MAAVEASMTVLTKMSTLPSPLVMFAWSMVILASPRRTIAPNGMAGKRPSKIKPDTGPRSQFCAQSGMASVRFSSSALARIETLLPTIVAPVIEISASFVPPPKGRSGLASDATRWASIAIMSPRISAPELIVIRRFPPNASAMSIGMFEATDSPFSIPWDSKRTFPGVMILASAHTSMISERISTEPLSRTISPDTMTVS
jgi:hypothetical protein